MLAFQLTHLLVPITHLSTKVFCWKPLDCSLLGGEGMLPQVLLDLRDLKVQSEVILCKMQDLITVFRVFV